MVACRSPKPKMGVRLTPCLFGNVCESMGQRLNLQICEDTGRKMALPKVLSIGVNGCILEFDSSGAGSNPASAVFMYLPSCSRNGIAPVLKTGVRKGMGVRIPQTAFKFAQLKWTEHTATNRGFVGVRVSLRMFYRISSVGQNKRFLIFRSRVQVLDAVLFWSVGRAG